MTPDDFQLQLPDGAIVRGARTDEDITAVLALEADREGEDDAFDLELVARGDRTRIGVVEKDGEIVSTATLLDERIRVGEVTLAAGQVEMVATRQDAEGRGYVRALMDRCHRMSAARGDVLQVMIGIPNFYRQFGYHYSIPMHAWRGLDRVPDESGGLLLRPAGVSDRDTLRRLQDAAQSQYDIAMPHSDECWSWILQHRSSTQWLAEDSQGQAQAAARIAVYDGAVYVGEPTSASDIATRALLRHASSLADDDGEVTVQHRPHVPGMDGLLGSPGRREWYYLRTESPAQVLRDLAPELVRRVHEAGLDSGDALISFFRSHVRLRWDTNGLEVTEGGALQAPVSQGGSGIPLDAFGSMLLGGGAPSLEDRFPDASLGRQADLMTILFPAQRSDFLTFYLPA